MSVLFAPAPPMGSTSHTHKPLANGHAAQSTFLRDLTANPLIFGEPVGRASFAPQTGLREVFPGPPSPPRSLLRLEKPQVNGVEEGRGEKVEEVGTVVKEKGKKKEKQKQKEQEKKAELEEGELEDGEVEEKEEVKQVKRAVLGPSTPPHLRRKDALPASSPDLPPSVPPSTGTTPSKKPNGHIPAPSPATTPHASTSSAGSSSARSLHAHIPDTDLQYPLPVASVQRKAAGLYNPSMACYANATLQVMMHTPPFVKQMLGHREEHCLLSKNDRFCLLCIMRSMVSDHWTKKAYAPRSVHGHLGTIKKGFNKNRQEDTHEFFRFACDALQNTALAGLPKNLPEDIKHTTWVHRLWGGRVRSRVVCSRCNKPSDTFDHFLDLSLDCGAGKRTLTAMLQGFIKDDKLEGDNKYHCESCKGKANATKSFRIAEAPPVLTLHLKRFSMNYNSWNGKARADKYNLHIGFEEYLDIAPYMVDRAADGRSTKYKLFGVTCHRGAELRFGHYTAYVLAPNGKWYQADDEDVSPVSLADVKGDKTAYLLSYIRLAEGEDIPSGARMSGHGAATNGESSVGAGKRKREEVEAEQEQEARRPAMPGSGRKFEAMKEPIRKVAPITTPSAPLFPSVHDQRPSSSYVPRQPQANGHTPQQQLPSPPNSDRGTDEDEPRIPSFGSAMNGSYRPKSDLLAPTPIPAATFYQNSPVPRSSNPGPPSPGGGKWGKKGRHNKSGRPHSNSSPYLAGGGERGGNRGGRGGFGGRGRGVLGRMRP